MFTSANVIKKRKVWWGQLENEWKEFFKEVIHIENEPTTPAYKFVPTLDTHFLSFTSLEGGEEFPSRCTTDNELDEIVNLSRLGYR